MLELDRNICLDISGFDVKCKMLILKGANHDTQKEKFVRSLAPETVVALKGPHSGRILRYKKTVSNILEEWLHD